MSMDTRDIVVTSWRDLCDRLYDDSWQPELERFRSNYVFRGMADKDERLETGFVRLCGARPHLEYHLLRNFRKYAQREEPGTTLSDWRWLTIAQHHGLPTRLLDWSYSPFVALHFATADTQRYDRDAVVWHVDYVKVNRGLPPPLIDVLDDVGANAFTVEMLERALPDLHSFDRLSDEGLVVFFEPPSVHPRIVNQFALFSIMSDPTGDLSGWLRARPSLFRRIIIPKKLKWEVRDKLDQANITERMLFPGLDGLAKWLTRHYTPAANTGRGGTCP